MGNPEMGGYTPPEAKKEVFGTLMESANADEEKERVAFARAVVEEFAKLVERRMQESAGHDDEKGGAFRKDDEKQLQWIKETFLPQIESGDFDLVVRPAGIIAVETSDRRIALNAPDQNWDKEFEESVRKITEGSAFAKKVFDRKESNSKE